MLARIILLWLIDLGLLAFTRMLGMDPKTANDVCSDAITATKDKNMHAYCPQ
jgi:hypothetical protein